MIVPFWSWNLSDTTPGVYILFENSYTFHIVDHNFSLNLSPPKIIFALQVKRSDVGKIGRFEGGKARRSESGKLILSTIFPQFLPYTFHTIILVGDLRSPASNKIYSPAGY